MRLRRYTCRNVRELLPLHAGGDLDPHHVGAVDEHLHGCLSCFREFRELATMRGRLGALAEDPLPKGILDGFTDEVMARIVVDEDGPAAELPEGRVLQLMRTPTARYAAAAALLLVCVFGLHGIGGGAFNPFGLGPVGPDGPGLVEHPGFSGVTMAGGIPLVDGDRSADVPVDMPSTGNPGYLGPSGGVPVGFGAVPTTLELHYPGDQAIPEGELRWDDAHKPRVRPSLVPQRR